MNETPRTALLLSIVALFALGTSLPATLAASEWGYSSRDGHIPPVDWGEVSSTCRTGQSQSPISISTAIAVEAADLQAPQIDYGMSDLRVFNNGHTIEAEVDEGAGTIWIEGEPFELLQFHIHYGSEHFVDGQRFYAEIHLVHADEDGHLAVLGSLLKRGDSSVSLRPFFRAAQHLPHEGDEREVFDFDLNQLIPQRNDGYHHYRGSLTTPPCSQEVSWWVMKKTRTISSQQLDHIKFGIPPSENPQGNRRPVQSRRGRMIYDVGE